MELVLKGRGARVPQRLRTVTEHKLGRLERLEPKLTRVEVAVVTERNPRQGGMHRIEVVAATPRKTFRAHADDRSVESALDLVAERLERQIRDHHERRRARLIAGASRVKSAQVAPTTPDEDDARSTG
ncbi:MAG TPA: ribosome-associated translation inhibitor RaiA [Actinomycetota bacterium]|nr:ribosome-associated translation inhibitor RaiA [Actinomycetota bacterium]